MAEASGGVFRTSDLKALGYNTYAIRKLVNEKVIERVKSCFITDILTGHHWNGMLRWIVILPSHGLIWIIRLSNRIT